MKQQRTRLYVDQNVQGALAKRIGCHWFCFFGIVIALKLLTTWTMNPTASFGEITSHVVETNGLFFIVLVLLLPSFVFDTVKVSNRFAGPMVRLKTELKLAAEKGELREIKFREGDFWLEIAESYNDMVRSITGKSEGKESENELKNEDETENANEVADDNQDGPSEKSSNTETAVSD